MKTENENRSSGRRLCCNNENFQIIHRVATLRITCRIRGGNSEVTKTLEELEQNQHQTRIGFNGGSSITGMSLALVCCFAITFLFIRVFNLESRVKVRRGLGWRLFHSRKPWAAERRRATEQQARHQPTTIAGPSRRPEQRRSHPSETTGRTETTSHWQHPIVCYKRPSGRREERRFVIEFRRFFNLNFLKYCYDPRPCLTTGMF